MIDKIYDTTLDLILEDISLGDMQFQHSKVLEEVTGGAMIVEGIIASADKPNRNNRIYPWDVLLEAVNIYVAKYVEEGTAYGELDHPGDGEARQVNLSEASHIIDSIEADEKARVIKGRIRVLDTPAGKILRELFNANNRVGISSRGSGKTTRNKDGYDITLSPLSLLGFDFVSIPSAEDAYVSLV